MPTAATRTLHVAQVAFAVIFCVTCSGVVFGFAALKPVLVRQGVYRGLCVSRDEQRDDQPCEAQNLRLNSLFTYAAVTSNVVALPVGIILDKIGPRWTSLLGAAMFAVGNVAFGYGQEGPLDTYLLGFIALAIGGPLIYMSAFHLSNAFPTRSGLVMSLITGAFDVSSVPFLVLYWLDSSLHGGLPIRTFFWVYTAIPALIVLEQCAIGPPRSYSLEEFEFSGPEPPTHGILVTHEVYTHSEIDLEESERAALVRSPSPSPPPSAAKEVKHAHDPVQGTMVGVRLRQQLMSRWFITVTVFLCIHAARINYYIQTVHSQLQWYLVPSSAQRLADSFAILLPLGGVISVPILGYLLDIRGLFDTTVVVLAAGALYGLLGTVPNVTAQALNVLLFVVFRPVMYTYVNDYCAKVFGFETFGTVLGLSSLLSGTFGLVLRPIDLAVAGPLRGNYTPVNIAGILAGLVTSAALIWVIRQAALRPGRIRLRDSDSPL
ncbi:hypothetical protein AURDEDRAFT_141988, partial [Auricularia subglabra TFB-10046 SS5]